MTATAIKTASFLPREMVNRITSTKKKLDEEEATAAAKEAVVFRCCTSTVRTMAPYFPLAYYS